MRDRHRMARVLVTLAVVCFAAEFSTAEDASPPTPSEPSGSSSPAPPNTVVPAFTILNSHEVEGILGREVVGAANEYMGRIVDVIVDRTRQVRAAVIDFGGFLGVGSRKIAVDWNALHFPAPAKKGGRITLELTRDQVRAAPEYRDGQRVVVLGALGKLVPLPYP